MTKQEILPKGVRSAKFDFAKTFRNPLFSQSCKGIITLICNSKSI